MRVRASEPRRGYLNWPLLVALLCAVVLLAAAVVAYLMQNLSKAEIPTGPAYAAFSGEAFPGAEGFGRFARGGRLGKIIEVTNLDNDGPGSLRACIEAVGPRVCIFRVGGVIRFTTERPVIRNPYLTIAGQTAPGGGILITHAGGSEGFTPIVVKGTHDVIIRHVRVRPDRNGDSKGSNGAFLFEDSSNVVFDHVSGSWALDQIMSGYGQNDNITIAWSIFAKGVPKHDKCALLASDPRGAQKISFIKNLCAHNGDRNPDVNFPPGSCVEVVNNVLYNAQSQFAEVHETFGGTPVNFIGNYFQAGRNTRPQRVAIDWVATGKTGLSRIYTAGNELDGVSRETSPMAAAVLVDKPVCPSVTTAMNAAQAYQKVLERAGAFPRDAFDIKTIDEVRTRSGSIMKLVQKGPRKLPPIAPGEPYIDSDGDGMSDRWEEANGLDPDRSDAWGDVNRNGWLNLDEFLDYAHREVIAGRIVQ